jgi:molybdenum cofactor cytidylyltransferase
MSFRAIEQVPPAIILAAGASSRLGQPKSFVDLGGITLIEWVVQRLRKQGFSVLIVGRQEHTERYTTLIPDILIEENPVPEQGRMSSIQAGIQGLLNRNISLEHGVLIVPIDRPGFPEGMLSSLYASPSSACVANPERRGHPVFITCQDIELVQSAPPSLPLRECVTFTPFVVEAPFLSLNIDTEQDIESLQQWYTIANKK